MSSSAPSLPTPTAAARARATWCSARPRALPPTSTCRPWTAPTASTSPARRGTTPPAPPLPPRAPGTPAALPPSTPLSSADAIAAGGDVVIVGVVAAATGGSCAGASYLVFGHASGFASNLELSDLNGANGFQITGSAADHAGRSVSAAGDVNGDG